MTEQNRQSPANLIAALSEIDLLARDLYAAQCLTGIVRERLESPDGVIGVEATAALLTLIEDRIFRTSAEIRGIVAEMGASAVDERRERRGQALIHLMQGANHE